MPKKKELIEQPKTLVLAEQVESRIIIVRGQKVMIDSDLADIYGITTKRLNEQVKRNKKRFPEEEFMFQLTNEEKLEVVANCDHLKKLKFSPVLPNAFTEHGAVMLASVINSHFAIEVSIQIVRAFVKMRSILAVHKDLARKIEEIENKYVAQDKKIDTQYKTVLDLIKRILKNQQNQSQLSTQNKRQIGFRIEDKKDKD